MCERIVEIIIRVYFNWIFKNYHFLILKTTEDCRYFNVNNKSYENIVVRAIYLLQN